MNATKGEDENGKNPLTNNDNVDDNDDDDEEEDLEKLQAEIERMEAEAARITKETEDLEKGKGSTSSNNKKEDPKDAMKRDGCVFCSIFLLVSRNNSVSVCCNVCDSCVGFAIVVTLTLLVSTI
jgi:hypothetical protein